MNLEIFFHEDCFKLNIIHQICCFDSTVNVCYKQVNTSKVASAASSSQRYSLSQFTLLLKESKTKQSCKVQSLQPILLVVYLSQSNCSIHSTTPDWLAGYTGMIKTCWLKYQIWLTYCRRDGNLGEGLGTRLAKQTSLSGESEGEVVGLAIRF